MIKLIHFILKVIYTILLILCTGLSTMIVSFILWDSAYGDKGIEITASIFPNFFEKLK